MSRADTRRALAVASLLVAMRVCHRVSRWPVRPGPPRKPLPSVAPAEVQIPEGQPMKLSRPMQKKRAERAWTVATVAPLCALPALLMFDWRLPWPPDARPVLRFDGWLVRWPDRVCGYSAPRPEAATAGSLAAGQSALATALTQARPVLVDDASAAAGWTGNWVACARAHETGGTRRPDWNMKRR